jgi:hypothetical protein
VRQNGHAGVQNAKQVFGARAKRIRAGGIAPNEFERQQELVPLEPCRPNSGLHIFI